MKELKELDLLMDGEISIQPEGAERPFIYRGFQMIDEKKLQERRGDQLRKANQNGVLPRLYAHLFSLSRLREILGSQMKQGKRPQTRLERKSAGRGRRVPGRGKPGGRPK